MNLKSSNNRIKDKLFRFMKKNNINLQYHYIPIYKFKVFKYKFVKGQGEEYYKSTVSLPIFVDLEFKQIDFILKKLGFFFKKIFKY